MKANLHPTYYPEAVVTCVCGNTFTTGSTKEKIEVDICSKCHPFYTGEMKFIDKLGHVDKFLKKQAAAAGYQKKSKSQPKPQGHQSLKEMLTVTKIKKS
jgi:large subunit ribosomal protein L31